MKIENTTCIVVEREGKILLVKRANRTFHGWWCLLGGHAEKGETLAQGAQREAEEETGKVKVENKPFMVFVHDWPADSHTKEPHKHRCHTFMGRVSGELKAGSDAAKLKWFTPDEAKKLKITEYTRRVLEKLSETEYFVVVDKKDRALGKASREECHSNKNLLHRGIVVIVLNSKGDILFEKRSMKKDLYPGYWGFVGGHVNVGESYEQAAKREMMEEIGVECDIREIFKGIIEVKEEKEMTTGFVCVYDGSFRINKEESDEARFFSQEKIKKALESGGMKITEWDKHTLRIFMSKKPLSLKF